MLYYTSSLPNNHLQTAYQRYLWFSGTAYLGIAQHPVFQQAFVEAVAQWGTSWGSSRNNTIRLEVYEEAEQLLAQHFNAPACLTMPSGMAAGQLCLQYVQQQGFTCLYAPRTHPALWGSDAQIPTQTYTQWTQTIAEQVQQHPATKLCICSDSIGSPYVEAFRFDWIQALPNNKEIMVLLDASHSLGIQNFSDLLGCSTIFEPNSNVKLVVTSSLNKAMGMPGGIILGNAPDVQAMRMLPSFAGSSPMMPALLQAYIHVHELYPIQKDILLKNITLFNQNLQAHYFASLPAYPAYCTQQEGLHEYLKQHGIMTSCFPYPSVHDKPVSRIVISAMHSQEDIAFLAEKCNAFSF